MSARGDIFNNRCISRSCEAVYGASLDCATVHLFIFLEKNVCTDR